MPKIKYQGGKARGKNPGGSMSDYVASQIIDPLANIDYPKPIGKIQGRNLNKKYKRIRYQKRSAIDMPRQTR